jgi:acetyl-CoA carboxylase beta subunit
MNQKKRRSDTLKERYKNQDHHLKGKDPWNKGKKGSQVGWNKGLEMEKIQCPYCDKFVDIANGKRWHFNNCKNKKTTE